MVLVRRPRTGSHGRSKSRDDDGYEDEEHEEDEDAEEGVDADEGEEVASVEDFEEWSTALIASQKASSGSSTKARRRQRVRAACHSFPGTTNDEASASSPGRNDGTTEEGGGTETQ
eukprot:CAMPEP_0184656950 /NCGR_PEP_ID=MMETSP0308-20130426/16867_1 /TAXON_ID=38269 /ORGANISM="Gloeochaete witrockiana, Strain SAG 46.84" /LENGTH=115 /DNA_ID=CAMNT_0027094289 /DNA_START=1 /DNA_END=348 /DNA_ORIENTATION=+